MRRAALSMGQRPCAGTCTGQPAPAAEDGWTWGVWCSWEGCMLRPAHESRVVIFAVMSLLISCTFLFSCAHDRSRPGRWKHETILRGSCMQHSHRHQAQHAYRQCQPACSPLALLPAAALPPSRTRNRCWQAAAKATTMAQ